MSYFYSFAVFGPKLTEQSNIQFGVNNPENFSSFQIWDRAIFQSTILFLDKHDIQSFYVFLGKVHKIVFGVLSFHKLLHLIYATVINRPWMNFIDWHKEIIIDQNHYQSKSLSWWSFPFRWSVLLLQELPGASSASLAASWIRYELAVSKHNVEKFRNTQDRNTNVQFGEMKPKTQRFFDWLMSKIRVSSFQTQCGEI